jgi:ClpP class serine protease
LLEISVWAIYATRTRNNARRLYEDAGRDIRGIYDAFSKWGDRTHQGDVYRAAKVELATNAKLLGGIDSIEGKYKPVAEAADELGLGEYYSVIYKLLSKFAHPTAMLMLGNIDAEKRRLQRGFFYGQGCLQFTTAFSELERTLALAS